MRGWEQIGSSGLLPTALNGVQSLSTALDGSASLQVVSGFAGQRLADRSLTQLR